MTDAQKKTRSQREPKSGELKNNLTYNELRRGIVDEINSIYDSPSIKAYEKAEEDSVTLFLEEFKEDTNVPTDLDLLYNYNASINTTLSKWIKRHAKYTSGLSKNERKLVILDAKITQKYKREVEAHNGLLLSDKEIKNIIIINEEHIDLEEKINSIKAVISVIEMAMSRLKDMSFTIKNALETLRIKHYIVNGNI